MSAVLWCLGGASGGAILGIVVMGALSNGAIRDRDDHIRRQDEAIARLSLALFKAGQLQHIHDHHPDSDEDDIPWSAIGMGTYTPERR